MALPVPRRSFQSESNVRSPREPYSHKSSSLRPLMFLEEGRKKEGCAERWGVTQDHTLIFMYTFSKFNLLGSITRVNYWRTMTITLKNYGRRFVALYRRRWPRPSQRKRNARRHLWLSEEALQTAEERRELKGKGERERYTQLNAEFQRIARSYKKAFLSEQCKEIEENNRMGKTRDLFMKI